MVIWGQLFFGMKAVELKGRVPLLTNPVLEGGVGSQQGNLLGFSPTTSGAKAPMNQSGRSSPG